MRWMLNARTALLSVLIRTGPAQSAAIELRDATLRLFFSFSAGRIQLRAISIVSVMPMHIRIK